MKVTNYASFAELPADARAVAAQYRDINPFVCDLWLSRYEEYLLGDHDRAMYLVVSDQQQCIAMLPLISTKLDNLPIRKVHSMANFYTSVFEPLLSTSTDRLAVAGVIADYFSAEFKSYPLIEIEPLRDCEIWEKIADRYSRDSGNTARHYQKHINRYEMVNDDDFNSYLARRPGTLRSTIKRKRNQLHKNTQSTLDIYSTSEGITREYPKFCTIYAESWKGTEKSPGFIGAITGALADVGKAKLGILTVNGEPAAAQIWFKIRDGWGVFKLAYRPKFSQYSVGTLLTASMVESFFADGRVSEIDFFSGDDAYKKDWVAQYREHIGIEFIQSGNMVGKVLNLKRRIAGN